MLHFPLLEARFRQALPSSDGFMVPAAANLKVRKTLSRARSLARLPLASVSTTPIFHTATTYYTISGLATFLPLSPLLLSLLLLLFRSIPSFNPGN